MNPGDVVQCTSITIVGDDQNGKPMRETWCTKKKHRFVFLLLGIENSDETGFDPKKALREMGWIQRKPAKR